LQQHLRFFSSSSKGLSLCSAGEVLRALSVLFFKKAKIVACEPKPNYRVWIQFDDGLEGEVDLSHLVGKGVFEAWESVDFFNQVQVDPESETLTWGDEIDLDPYVLREKLENSKQSKN
jgi:hypothetical protein